MTMKQIYIYNFAINCDILYKYCLFLFSAFKQLFLVNSVLGKSQMELLKIKQNL